MSSSSRVFRKVLLDKYCSPLPVVELVKSLCTDKNTIYVDPCAGDGALHADKKYDIQSGTDFFTTTRDTFQVPDSLTFVMNPPFSLPKQRNGVVLFLNHAETCMHNNEKIICVAPCTMRKWTNISKVSKNLTLKEEHILEKPQIFSGKHKVSTVVQVWVKTAIARLEPTLLSSSPLFHATFSSPGTFYIKVWGVLNKIGIYNDVQTAVGTLTRSNKGGTAKCIRVKTKEKEVRERFQDMYNNGEWKEYMAFKCAGNNNPVIISKDIYTLYHKGIEYLKKENYNIKVIIH